MDRDGAGAPAHRGFGGWGAADGGHARDRGDGGDAGGGGGALGLEQLAVSLAEVAVPRDGGGFIEVLLLGEIIVIGHCGEERRRTGQGSTHSFNSFSAKCHLQPDSLHL